MHNSITFSKVESSWAPSFLNNRTGPNPVDNEKLRPGALGVQGCGKKPGTPPPRAAFSQFHHRARLKDQTPLGQHFINILI